MNEGFILDSFTTIACGIIILAFIASWIYIASKDCKSLTAKRKWIEQLPSIISTLGVLGTFLGITKGLMSFDTEHLDTSIPVLLSGLKTAFFTSLCGMFGSLILNRVVSHKIDSELTESEEMKAAKLIISELAKNHNSVSNLLKTNNNSLVKAIDENDTIKAIKQDLEQLKDDIEEIKGHAEEMKGYIAGMKGHTEKLESLSNTISTELDNIKRATESNSEAISKVRAVLVTATASISAIDNNVEELNSTVNGIGNYITAIIDNLSDVK
jgi:predicted  nucleic acid-binding Zn-ribbon protein